jgi:hypothetical protein
MPPKTRQANFSKLHFQGFFSGQKLSLNAYDDKYECVKNQKVLLQQCRAVCWDIMVGFCAAGTPKKL